MIHSLSGGVIKSSEKYTFIKVEVGGETRWLVCDDTNVAVGDTAVFDDGKTLIRGKVLRVDKGISGDCAPVPLKKIGKTEAILK